MKFRFKIQQYQTDAVYSVVRVFNGQPYSDGISYAGAGFAAARREKLQKEITKLTRREAAEEEV